MIKDEKMNFESNGNFVFKMELFHQKKRFNILIKIIKKMLQKVR